MATHKAHAVDSLSGPAGRLNRHFGKTILFALGFGVLAGTYSRHLHFKKKEKRAELFKQLQLAEQIRQLREDKKAEDEGLIPPFREGFEMRHPGVDFETYKAQQEPKFLANKKAFDAAFPTISH